MNIFVVAREIMNMADMATALKEILKRLKDFASRNAFYKENPSHPEFNP